MAGYSNHSMSNNAVAAYSDGRKPLSKIKGTDLVGWPHTLAFAKWLAKTNCWQPSEWHHTSKEYNRTDFYDPQDLLEYWIDLDAEEQQALLEGFAIASKPAVEETRVKGTYIEWQGSRRHPVAVEREFTGTKRGNWIHLDGGGKKKANGNHITYRQTN